MDDEGHDHADPHAVTLLQQAVRCVVLMQPIPEGLNLEEQQILDDLTPWLRELRPSDTSARDQDGGGAHSSEQVSVRPDDPVALMLGLVMNPELSVQGSKLAAARQNAHLKVSDLAVRLQRRGWQVPTKEVLSWELGTASLAPALIAAIADELQVDESQFTSGLQPGHDLAALFDDSSIQLFIEEWATDVGQPASTVQAKVSRALVGAGKRHTSATSPDVLLAVLKAMRETGIFLDPR